MGGLDPDIPIPAQPQPGQVLKNRRGEFRLAAPAINILQPEEKKPTRRPRPRPPAKRRKRVAEVQIAGGTRRESSGQWPVVSGQLSAPTMDGGQLSANDRFLTTGH
jgi:hypothetical protein